MGVFKGIIVLLLGLGVIGFMSYTAEKAGQRSQEVQLAQVQVEAEKTFEMQAVEEISDVANAAFLANVAIATSGDVAQASMAKSFSNSIMGIAAIIIGVVALVMYLDHRKGSQRDREQEPYRLETNLFDKVDRN